MLIKRVRGSCGHPPASQLEGARNNCISASGLIGLTPTVLPSGALLIPLGKTAAS